MLISSTPHLQMKSLQLKRGNLLLFIVKCCGVLKDNSVITLYLTSSACCSLVSLIQDK